MVLYASPREAGVDIVYRQRADGTGNSEALTSGKNHFYPISIAPKGHEVVLVDGSDSIMTLAVLHLDGTNRITSLLQNSSQNLNGEVSPDGRWLAYQSDETGRYEIFVRPYPNAQNGAKRTISVNGGTKPLWARSGNELFYIDAEGYLMAVQFQTRSGVASGHRNECSTVAITALRSWDARTMLARRPPLPDDQRSGDRHYGCRSELVRRPPESHTIGHTKRSLTPPTVSNIFMFERVGRLLSAERDRVPPDCST